MKLLRLTPEILRAAADRLEPLALPTTPGCREYMCLAVNAVTGGYDHYHWELFQTTLAAHGVPLGGLLDYYDTSSSRYATEAPMVRFMFLEFLALDLESQ
jgi:hypothetical protein